jgi:hypothetical protein
MNNSRKKENVQWFHTLLHRFFTLNHTYYLQVIKAHF